MKRSVILRRHRRTLGKAKSPWTQARIEYLVTRWSEGASAREISGELGRRISRNAVLSLIYRLGIANVSPFGGRRGRRSDKKVVGKKGTGSQSAVAWGRPPSWAFTTKPYVDGSGTDADIPRSQRRSLQELTEDTCRWPVGDPRTVAFFFCGAQPLPKKPYCARHCARAEWIEETDPPPFEAGPNQYGHLWAAEVPDAPALDDIRQQNPKEWEDA